MTNNSKFLVLGLLAALSACGGDDSPNTTVDAGGPIIPVVVDAGNKPDSGAILPPANDAGNTNPGDGDAGVTLPTDCFSGTPVAMVDFLNRCSGAQNTSKPTLGIPAALLTADGGVLPLTP